MYRVSHENRERNHEEGPVRPCTRAGVGWLLQEREQFGKAPAASDFGRYDDSAVAYYHVDARGHNDDSDGSLL